MSRNHNPGFDEAPEIVIDPFEGAKCSICGKNLHSGARGYRSICKLDGPVIFTKVKRRCCDPKCEGYRIYRQPTAVMDRIAMRRGDFGLDVILRIGELRIKERQSLSETYQTLRAQYPELVISERTVARLIHDYNALVVTATLAPAVLAEKLNGRTEITISIDGLQPDQDQDMLWLIRDQVTGTPLAAATWPSASHLEIVDLLRQVARLGLTIKAVVSDGQDCILKAVEEELPGVPHQVCQFHFIKNVAKPLMDRDGELHKQLKKGSAA